MTVWRVFQSTVLLAVGAGIGCTSSAPAPALFPPDLTKPPSSPWPESQQHVRWQPQEAKKWQVSVGNNTVVVSAQQKSAAQHHLREENTAAWGQQINHWRQQMIVTPWELSTSAPTSSYSPQNPKHVWVFVSPQCDLCAFWKQEWPAQIPVTWVPVASFVPAGADPLWSATWCVSEFALSPTQQGDCQNVLSRQYQRMRAMGVVQTPAVVDNEGRLLTGWPDAAWLVHWWSPRAVYQGPSPEMVNEPDI